MQPTTILIPTTGYNHNNTRYKLTNSFLLTSNLPNLQL